MKHLRRTVFATLAAVLLLQTTTVFAGTEITEEFELGLCNSTGKAEELTTMDDVATYQAGSTKVSILGDSISTFYSYTQYSEVGNYYPAGNVQIVDNTWWMGLLKEEGWSLGVNESLGGSRVTWDGKTENSYLHQGKNYYMASDARISQLGKNGTPDKIFVFGGLNDILAQGGVTIGSYSNNLTYGKVDTFADAYYTMITKLRTTYPGAEIVCITPYDTIYTLDRTETAEAAAVVNAICDKFGLKYIDLRKVGISATKDLLIGESDSYIHPNANGMAKIKSYLVKELKRSPGLTEENGKLYYYNKNGNLVMDSYETIDGNIYYFQADGSAMTNQLTTDETGKYKIYFGSDGRMVKSAIAKASNTSYYFDEDGHMVYDQIVRIEDKIYYFDKTGAMYTKTSYTDSDGNIRFFRSDGTMVYNDYYCDGTYTYYMQNDGTAMKDRLTYDPEGTGLIYFNSEGHMLFDTFQYCKDVKYTCYFATDGRAYFNQVTFVGNKAYYINACGKMEDSGWFQFANGLDYGFANWDGTLHTEGFSYDPQGRVVFYYWNGMVARGLITDGVWYYNMDMTDGHYLGQFQ